MGGSRENPVEQRRLSVFFRGFLIVGDIRFPVKYSGVLLVIVILFCIICRIYLQACEDL